MNECCGGDEVLGATYVPNVAVKTLPRQSKIVCEYWDHSEILI